MTGSIAPNRPGHHGTVVARTVGTVAISCKGSWDFGIPSQMYPSVVKQRCVTAATTHRTSDGSEYNLTYFSQAEYASSALTRTDVSLRHEACLYSPLFK